MNFRQLLDSLLLTRASVRRVAIIAVHASLWGFALVLALLLRFDGDVPTEFARGIYAALAALVVSRIVAFSALKLFHGMWRYAGMPELKSLLYATSLGSMGFTLIGLMVPAARVPRSLYFGEFLASIVLVGGLRFALRVVRERASGRIAPDALITVIVGAGDVGESLLRDMQRSPLRKWNVVGFLDDDPYKQGSTIRDIPVLGKADEASLRRAKELREVQLVVIAIPNASGKRTREVVNCCRKLGLAAKILPSLPDRIDGQNFTDLRDVAIEDLLQRDPIELDVPKVASFLAGETILVTGAGGSIGSELCRQIVRFAPKSLLLLDHDENALYQIERELAALTLKFKLIPVMADIVDKRRIQAIFAEHRPSVVFHAAAHKHVTMMEKNPCEAAKNNAFGTETVALAASEYGAAAFVMVSTDKAVNPTSVMGATKRVAEMVCQRIAETSRTRFCAVRFGNVLGSAGSVVPLFREQIARGGPITVTHPDVCRYFMTIPEASQLVLQAGALGGTGEIFLLDMGQPVKIVNLARDLIELSGLRPDIDIAIEFTGLRPGEKLFEELLLDGEAYGATPHPKILVGKIQPTERAVFQQALTTLRERALAGDEPALRRLLGELVPEATLGQASPPIPISMRPAPPANRSESDRSQADRGQDELRSGELRSGSDDATAALQAS